MIYANMRDYNYYLYDKNNDYGQRILIKDDTGEPVVQGTVKISITNTSTTIQDNIKYKDATYIGLTLSNITDAYVIQYGDTKLKVLYVIPAGRYKQVFLNEQ